MVLAEIDSVFIGFVCLRVCLRTQVCLCVSVCADPPPPSHLGKIPLAQQVSRGGPDVPGVLYLAHPGAHARQPADP